MRTASQAVAAANQWHTNRPGMCLLVNQTWFAAPWSGPWAYWAWDHWGGKHPGDRNPPPGVPVYFRNPRSKYGHIALSLGGGRIRSTDWPHAGVVGNTTIGEQERAWAISYVGWADRFSGGPIAGIQHPGTAHHARRVHRRRRYRVQAGDTLGTIAAHFNTSWQRLARLNNLSDPNHIAVGQRLRVR